MKKIFLILALLILLTGCEVVDGESPQKEEKQVEQHSGKCLEYKTEYKLDCGWFTCKDEFCCERKYDVCVRWEE